MGMANAGGVRMASAQSKSAPHPLTPTNSVSKFNSCSPRRNEWTKRLNHFGAAIANLADIRLDVDESALVVSVVKRSQKIGGARANNPA
jgi:hypothetical protein